MRLIKKYYLLQVQVSLDCLHLSTSELSSGSNGYSQDSILLGIFCMVWNNLFPFYHPLGKQSKLYNTEEILSEHCPSILFNIKPVRFSATLCRMIQRTENISDLKATSLIHVTVLNLMLKIKDKAKFSIQRLIGKVRRGCFRKIHRKAFRTFQHVGWVHLYPQVDNEADVRIGVNPSYSTLRTLVVRMVFHYPSKRSFVNKRNSDLPNSYPTPDWSGIGLRE